MEQLALPWLDRRVVIPIVPQPCKTEWWMGLTIPGTKVWAWPSTKSSTLVMEDPERSEGLLELSPYQVGEAFDSQSVIEGVMVRQTQNHGWVWVIFLRDFHEDDMEAFWSLFHPSLKRKRWTTPSPDKNEAGLFWSLPREPSEKDEDGVMRQTDFSLDV